MNQSVYPAIPFKEEALDAEALEEDAKPRRKSRAWVWALVWLAVFVAAPGYLIGLMYKAKSREFAASLPPLSAVRIDAAPNWLPLRGDFRVQSSYVGQSSGNAILLASEPVDSTAKWFDAEFRKRGFTVSTNSMQRDNSVSFTLLNAAHPAQGQSAMIAISRASTGTRVELSFTEGR